MNEATDFYEQLAVWSQVFGSVAFVIVLVYAFNRFVAPAVVASQERKNADLSEAERRRDAAKEDVVSARRELDGVEEEVKAVRIHSAVDSRRERERILADAMAEGARLVQAAEGELDRGRAAAREALRVELLEKALRAAHLAAMGEMDEECAAKLVSGVMEKIDQPGNGAETVYA